MSKNARITEIHDKDGSLTKLEAYDADTGSHVLDGHWDPSDDQTPDNREHFRRWFRTMLNRKGYDSIN